MTRGIIGAGLVVFTSMAALGQPAAAPPAFEVASVKPVTPSADGRMFRSFGGDPGMVDYKNVTLRILLARAYSMKDYQITGPDWLETEGYDVMAKVPAGVPQDQIPAMLQTLLADRFQIKLHKETRTLPVYALTVAKGGPKLKETDPTIVAAIQAARAAAGRGGSGAPPPPPAPGKGPPPGAIMIMMSTNGMTLRGSMEMSRLVNALSNFMDRPVLDSTGLKGTYDIELSYMPDESSNFKGPMGPMTMPPGGPGGGAGPAGGAGDARMGPAQDANAPVGNIFQALQSLGLKLESRKDPIESLVIDHANKVPTEN
ncbi:MAG: TIGR03435 family protein [Bryobacteraceae bacterium]